MFLYVSFLDLLETETVCKEEFLTEDVAVVPSESVAVSLRFPGCKRCDSLRKITREINYIIFCQFDRAQVSARIRSRVVKGSRVFHRRKQTWKGVG